MNHLDSLQDLLSKWTEAVVLDFPHLILGIVVFIIFYFLATWFKKLSFHLYSKRKSKRSEQTARVVSAFIYLFLLVSGLILALQSMQLESFLTKLLAGAGIMGILAGFAFKDIVSNAFSGVLIKYQKPYNVGDWVSIQEAFGKVQYVGWISTIIRNANDQLLHLPNQLVYNNIVNNYSQYKKRAVVFKQAYLMAMI